MILECPLARGSSEARARRAPEKPEQKKEKQGEE